MYVNILLFCIWLLGLSQRSVAWDQTPATSVAGLLNTATSFPYNASLPRRRNAPPPTDLIDKVVYFCTGHLNGPPHYDCPSETCSRWEGWIDTHEVEAAAKGTNCIDTDCNTEFTVCNRHGDTACTNEDTFTPSITPWNRCCYDVPGTDHIYLWA